MATRTAFGLDCNPIIPDCGYECDRCVQELESTLTSMQGVSGFYREGDGVVVEHDPAIITTEQQMDIFKTLPSFYPGNFIPSVIKT